ncbi:MAG: aminomethyl-transferring glycine dehydrogenase subunit GcvPB [Candidatus Diapherotrites archaeon]
MKTVFEKSVEGRSAVEFAETRLKEKPLEQLLPKNFLRKKLELPELSEVDVVRHFTCLSQKNFGVDSGFYPLGSCTMKYNPKANEEAAKLQGFALSHPLQPRHLSQGNLQLIFELQQFLAEITGMDSVTLQPAAGAHGELCGLMLAKKFFEKKGEKRSKVLVADSSHGTNPASATLCGLEAVTVKSNGDGCLDLSELKKALSKDVAVIMLTNPNTLGLFEKQIVEICRIVHSAGALVYCDGANANASLGKWRFGDLGIDAVHLNLHKTFSTPHGGGGPGAGAIAVKKQLAQFLPRPTVEKKGEKFEMNFALPDSIGKIKAFYGNFGVLVRAYTFIRALGAKGLKEAAENAVLNANYMKERLKKSFDLPYDRICQHEFVLSDKNMPNGVTTNDLAKRLIDYGFHPPTIYFPLIVHGAIMIEPTETESKETLDEFCEAMEKILGEAKEKPELVKGAPHSTPVKRLDAVKAAREPKINWFRENKL